MWFFNTFWDIFPKISRWDISEISHFEHFSIGHVTKNHRKNMKWKRKSIIWQFFIVGIFIKLPPAKYQIQPSSLHYWINSILIFFNRPRYFPNIVPWRLVHFLPLLGQKSKDIDKILVDFVNFRKFSQLWGALSPSSKRVMSSDRYRCQGMPMNFATHLIPSKTGTWRKS